MIDFWVRSFFLWVVSDVFPAPNVLTDQPNDAFTLSFQHQTQKYGYEDFLLKLTGPNGKIASSKLGLGYAKGPGGMISLFSPSEGKTAEIVDLKVYVVAR